MNHMTNANKQGWDRLAEIHTKNYHIDRLLSGEPLLNALIRSEVGDVRGKSLVHPLCHIGTDTLSWALLGAEVTGIDISPKSLQYARRLAARMGIEAGLRIEFLHEFPQYFYSGYTPYDVADDKVELYPCTFSLKARNS